MRVVIHIGGGLANEIFVKGSVHIIGDFMYLFFFLSIIDTLFVYLRSCDHFVIANLVLVDIYTFYVVITVISPISPCVVSFLSL